MADTVAAAVPFITAGATAIGAAASGYASIKASGAKTPKAAKLPAVAEVATAPDVDDAAVQRARLDAIRRRQAASGRASTNLTDETLG
jgi:hypothetical protein